jgi:hypothetical protein
VRRRVLADDRLASLPGDVRELSATAFGLLGHGLGDYPPGPVPG